MGEFTGKVVIITGASEGIGRALSLRMAREAPCLVLAARNESRLSDLASECAALGAKTQIFPCDLTRREDCERLIKVAAEKFGKIDALINNAGMTLWADYESMTDPDMIRKILEINYLSVAYTTYYALPFLRQSRGRLAATSSIAGVVGIPGHGAYGASKHAIHGLYDSLRCELADAGVSVTVICPDFVETEMHDRGFNARGEPMRKRLKPGQGISAERCASMMFDAIRKRRRLLMTSPRGIFAIIGRGLCPGLVDVFARRSVKHGLL
jgi:NAD(P)-dependent dehydrogenase (short-subunit alcohol dehydrogenase family)